MTRAYEAIYEHGTFRPVVPVAPALNEGQLVRIVVETDTPDEILRMAAEVYDGLTPQEVDAVEQIALDRSTFFTRPTV